MVVQVVMLGSSEIAGTVWHKMQVHDNGQQWVTQKRFTQFEALDQELAATHPGLSRLQLPEKGLFGVRKALNIGGFNEKRQVVLGQYLAYVAQQIQSLSQASSLEQFLRPPAYSVPASQANADQHQQQMLDPPILPGGPCVSQAFQGIAAPSAPPIFACNNSNSNNNNNDNPSVVQVALPVAEVPVQAIPFQAAPAQATASLAAPGYAVPVNNNNQAAPGYAVPVQAVPHPHRPHQAVPGYAAPCQAVPQQQPYQAVPVKAVPVAQWSAQGQEQQQQQQQQQQEQQQQEQQQQQQRQQQGQGQPTGVASFPSGMMSSAGMAAAAAWRCLGLLVYFVYAVSYYLKNKVFICFWLLLIFFVFFKKKQI
ncbi:unnamed protein product [Polarella glacialis]|uniref:PX domain-containing protein n=1 Tax=Polarella glacialis TaxID=89957 RepID=A0A813GN64_POLGL|nr:unnamed protein product [Polarella glacialis]